MLRADDSRDPGWIAMTCVNHPNFRWTRKDPEAMRGAISQNPQLGFDGDITRPELKVHPFDTSGKDMTPELKAKFEAEGWVFECLCPVSDLEYIHVTPSVSTEDPVAFINGLRDEVLAALKVEADNS
jgi:hypothetical protein